MCLPRKRRLPVLDVLEPRQLLSTSVPANTLASVDGTVASPGAVAEVSVPVTAHNINGRIPIVLGTATAPTAGSTLLPRVIAAIGPDGKPLALQQGAPFDAQTQHDEATAFFQDGTPGTVTLEVTGTNGTTGSFQLREYLPGDILGTGQVTFADLAAFPKYFQTKVGDANYNPAADANLNGQIGQEDARALVRNLNPGVRRTPLQINLFLKPSEAVKGHVPSNSGGHTYFPTVTIEGRTTPGSIVFFDSSSGDYTFNGGAAATNAQGDFSVTAKNTQGINNNDFLVISPFGEQKVQDYPIYYFPGVYSRTIKSRPAGTAKASAAAKGAVPQPAYEVLPAGTP